MVSLLAINIQIDTCIHIKLHGSMGLQIRKTKYIWFHLFLKAKPLKSDAALHLQLLQCTYQLHDENESRLQETLSYHLLQPSNSGQTSHVQGAYVGYLLSTPHLCFVAT